MHVAEVVAIVLLAVLHSLMVFGGPAVSDVCSGEDIQFTNSGTYSTITCSTSESAFHAGEKGTLNWDGWRCMRAALFCDTLARIDPRTSVRQINSMDPQHRCCLITNACIVDGQLSVFAPVDVVAEHNTADGGMFYSSLFGTWSPRVLSRGMMIALCFKP
jgi:hypothetical protein